MSIDNIEVYSLVLSNLSPCVLIYDSAEMKQEATNFLSIDLKTQKKSLNTKIYLNKHSSHIPKINLMIPRPGYPLLALPGLKPCILNIRSFQIIDKRPEADDFFLSNLAWIIRDFKSLIYIRIELSGSPSPHRRGLKKVLKSFRYLFHLKGFHLSINSREVNEKMIKRQLLNSISHLPNLKSFHLGFPDCKLITYKAFLLITDKVKLFSALKKFSLDFSNCHRKMVPFPKSEICRNNFSIANIDKINLEFMDYLDFSTRDMNYFISIFNSCPQLKTLSIKIGSENKNQVLDDEGLRNLRTCIKYLSKLKKLTLVFQNMKEITERGFRKMLEFIMQLQTIKNLVYKVIGCELDQVKLITAIESEPNFFKNLKSLDLKLEGLDEEHTLRLETFLNQCNSNLKIKLT